MNKALKSNQDVPMSRRRAKLLADYANRLAEMLENAPDDKDLAEWVQSKIDRAASAIQSAYHYLEHDELEKGASHKYIRRIPKGRDKRTGRMRYDYVYKEHHRGGLRAAVEDLKAGEAFKLKDPQSGQDGHFHVKAVKGNTVVVEHDETGRSVTMIKSELKALLMKEHGQALRENFQAKKETYERMKRDTPKHIGLKAAFNRLQAAADKAGIKLPATARERYASWYREQAAKQEPNKEVGALMRTPEPAAEPSANEAFNSKHRQAIKKIAAEVEEYQRRKSYSNKSKMEKLGTERALVDYLKSNFLTDSELTQKDQEAFSKMFNSFSITGKIADIIQAHPQIDDLSIENMSDQIRSIVTDLLKDSLNMLSMEADDRQTKSTRLLLKKYAKPKNAKELANHFDDILKITEFKGRRLRIQSDDLATMDVLGENKEIAPITFSDNGIDTSAMPKLTKEQIKPFKDALDILAPINESFKNKDNFETMPEPVQEPAPQPPARAQLIETAEPVQGQYKPIPPKTFAGYRRTLDTKKERLRHLKNIYEHPRNPSRLNRPNEFTTEIYAEVKTNLLEDIKELEDQTGEHTFKQPANSKELFTRVKRFFPEIETIYDRGITATIKVKAGQVKDLKSKLIKHPIPPINVTGDLLRDILLSHLIEILRGEENKAAYQAQSKDNFETAEPVQEPAQPAQPAKIDNFELAEHTHTKSGVKLYTAKQKDRVDRDEFKRRVQIAKKYKGRYDSRYAKAYLFKNAEDARKFALEVEGKPTDSTAPATNNFETMPEAESVDNFETMPEAESGTVQRLKEAHSLLEESSQKDEIKNGRRARASINADKKLIEHIQKIIDNDFKDTVHPSNTPFQDRTPKQHILMEMRGSLSHFKNEQTLLRGSRQDHSDIQKERNKSRRSLRTALNNLEKLSASNFETMPESKPKPKVPNSTLNLMDKISYASAEQKQEQIDGVKNSELKYLDAVDRNLRRMITVAKLNPEAFKIRYGDINLDQLQQEQANINRVLKEVEEQENKDFHTKFMDRVNRETDQEEQRRKEVIEQAKKLDAERKTAQVKAAKRLKRALSLVKKAERLDQLKNNRRSKAAKEADQALIAQVQHILENHLTDIDIKATYRKPSTMWTHDETLKVGLQGSIERLADKQKAVSTAYGGAKAAHKYRSDLRARLQEHLQDYLDRFISSEEIDARLNRELAAQQKEQAQADRHIQQVSFREDIQQKLDSTQIAKDPDSVFRLNKKGEIYGLKQQGYLYTNQTRENKLAHNINAEAESYLNVRSIQELIENAVANKQTPTELKQEIGKLIDEHQRKTASAAPRRIRTEIYEAHNRQVSAAKNLKGVIYNTDAIGLESIKSQTQDYTLKSNLSIYGAADNVLSTQERALMNGDSLPVYAYMLSQRYGKIADVRADAEKVKADIEQIGRQLLELLKQRTENHYQRTADQIEKAAAELRKNKLNEQRLRALIAAAEKKAEILTPEEKAGHDKEIADLKQNLDDVLKASAENASQAANWYENEARLTLKTGAKTTLGEVTDAIEKEGGNQLKIRTVSGTAKEKLIGKMFNEIMGRLVQESKNTFLNLPSSIQGDLKSTTESKPKEPQLISRQKEKTEQTIQKIDRERERLKEAAAQEKKEGHVYEKASKSLTGALVKRTTQDGKILNLGTTTDQNIKLTILNAIRDKAGTIRSEYVNKMLTQAISGNFDSYFGPQMTKRAVDTLLKEVKEAYSTGKPVEQAEREAQEAIQKALKFNLSRLIDRKVREYIQPRPAESYKLKNVEFTDRRLAVVDRRFNKFSAGTARSADPYNRIAAEYSSSKQLEAARDTIKEKTKEAYRQIVESWSDYQLNELRRDKANIDTTPAGIQRGQVIPAFKKLLSDLGIENESGSNDGKISLMAQLDNLQAIALESAHEHDAEAKAKQAHVQEMFRRYNAKIDELRNEDSKRQAQGAYLERALKDTYEVGKLSKRGAMVRDYQREAIRELAAELKAQSGPRISRFGENLDQRETVDLEPAPAPQPPARAQLIETTDQSAESAAVRITPSLSEERLTNYSSELNPSEIAQIYDRSRFLTVAKETPTKTLMRSKKQRAIDNELILMHQRLDIHAGKVLGPLKPRVTQAHKYGPMFNEGTREPEHREKIRAKIKADIQKLYRALNPVKKSAHSLINYRAALYKALNSAA